MDNMPTVVVERLGRLLRLTPKFLAYPTFRTLPTAYRTKETVGFLDG